MDVATILKRKGSAVLTVTPEISIAAVVKILREKRIGVVVVSDDGKRVQGILSERDVVRWLADDGAAVLDRPARELMTREVKTCKPKDQIADLMAQMSTHRIRHLPVVENGALGGMISIGDVVKYRLEEIEFEAEALKQYVANA